MYLYRAVDARRGTVGSYVSQNRDRAAARIFFRRALKRHDAPRTITLDGFEPSHSALWRMGRSSPYLNNIVEQNHRPVKFRVSAMLGFKSFRDARQVLAAIELIQNLKKGQ